MKLGPDNVRGSSEDIMTITTVRIPESSKPSLKASDMGQNEKESHLSSEEIPRQGTDVAEVSKSKAETEESQVEVKIEELLNSTNDLDENEDPAVDCLIEGINGCHLDQDVKQELVSLELSERLASLELKVDVVKETREATMARRQEPEEDDESEATVPGSQKETQEDDKATTSVPLIKLGAPVEEEEKTQSETDLMERSPAGGIPVYHNHCGNLTFDPYGKVVYPGNQGVPQKLATVPNGWPTMPGNFPAMYEYQTQQAVYNIGSKTKRGMNDLDYDQEAPKFFRPQMAPIDGLNNLDAPGQPTNGVKSINKVCRRQMSGGTVFTSNDLDIHAADNGNFETTSIMQQQQHSQHVDNIDFELQEVIDLLLDESLPEGTGQLSDPACDLQTGSELFLQNNNSQQQQQPLPSNFDDMFLPSDFGVASGTFLQQLPGQAGTGMTTQPMDNAQCQMLNQFPQQGEAMCQLPTPHQQRMMSPGKMTPPYLDDNGYCSDTMYSPSPPSVMEASPASSGSSPPQQNWSPPPSNLSNLSVDSGMYSPLAEDRGLSSQRSPRNVQAMSPVSASQITLIDNSSYLADTVLSPPQTGGLVCNPHPMSPPQYNVATSPPYLQANTAAATHPDLPGFVHDQQNGGSPPHPSNIHSLHQMSQSHQQVSEKVAEGYTSHFIDLNLPLLKDALDVAQEDLQKYMCKTQLTNLKNNHSQGVHSNIPSTVPQEITTSPRLLDQSSEPQFNGHNTSNAQGAVNSSLNMKKTSPAKKLVPKQPIPAAKTSTTTAITTTTTNNNNKANTPAVMNKIVFSNPVTVSCPTGTLVFTSSPALTSTTAPLVNEQGKVAIPAPKQKPRPTQMSTRVVPCLVGPNGQVTPVIVVPQEKPRYPAIAPKIASKPPGPSEANQSCRPVSGQNSQGQNCQREPIKVNDKLNIARRAVADMDRKDLIILDNEGDSNLHVAVVQLDHFIIEAYMERLVRENLREKMIDSQNHMGQTPLYLAVCDNKSKMTEVLVRHGADVKLVAEVKLDSGVTEKSAAIHRASSKGEACLDTLKALLKSPNIELNQVDSEGHTALHCAILRHGQMNTDNKTINSIPIIETLIQAGCDPNSQVQKNGKTALMFVLESRNIDLIESTFRLIEPTKLAVYLKTESFDGITSHKIASSIKPTLDLAAQQRLMKCMKPASGRSDH